MEGAVDVAGEQVPPRREVGAEQRLFGEVADRVQQRERGAVLLLEGGERRAQRVGVGGVDAGVARPHGGLSRPSRGQCLADALAAADDQDPARQRRHRLFVHDWRSQPRISFSFGGLPVISTPTRKILPANRNASHTLASSSSVVITYS